MRSSYKYCGVKWSVGMGVIHKTDWLNPQTSRIAGNPLGKIIAFGPDQKDINRSKISHYHLVRVLWDEDCNSRLVPIENLLLLHTMPIEEGLLHWSSQVREYYQKRAKREIARS